MNTLRIALLGWGCCLLNLSALAEHQIDLRGIINVSKQQAAILEVDHQHYVLQAGEQEEAQGRGQEFHVEVLEIDVTNEIVTTRIDGQIRTNSLPALTRSADAKSWIHLQNANLKVSLEIFGDLSNRTILLHPNVDTNSFSCEGTWNERTPPKDEVVDSFRKALARRDTSCLEDGDCFLQVLHTTMARTPTLNASKFKPPVAGQDILAPGWIDFVAVDAHEVINIYGKLIGYTQKSESASVCFCKPIYLKTMNPLSKAQIVYALETLLRWDGVQITLNQDKTFDVTMTSEARK